MQKLTDEMKRILIYIMAACTLAGCGGKNKEDARPVLTVSIEPQRKMLEELVGERYRVVTLLSAGADPENFEPTMSQRIDLSESQALFTVGHLAFEPLLAREAGSGTRVVDTSLGIEVVTGTHAHAHGDVHDEADPHVWTSMRNAKVMAGNMLQALVELDPDHADEYQARYEGMSQRLDSLDRAVAATIGEGGARAFAIWHPSLSYFARDYGLHQIAVGQENREVSAAKMKDIIDEAKDDSVRVFFAQKAYDTRQAEGISAEIGARTVTIDPLAYEWETELIQAANALAR